MGSSICELLLSLNIEIPSTVKYISPDAFSYSRAMMTVKFCDEVEELVSGVSIEIGGKMEFQKSL